MDSSQKYGTYMPQTRKKAKCVAAEGTCTKISCFTHMILCYCPLYCVSYPPCCKKSPTLPLYFLLTKIYFVSIPSANKQIKYGTHATFNNMTTLIFYHEISWSLLGVTCYVQAKYLHKLCRHSNSLPYGKQKLLVCHIFGL